MSLRAPNSRQQPGGRQISQVGMILGVGFLALVLIAIIYGIRAGYLSEGWRQHTGFVVFTGALGAFVGASELVSRYRDEPVLALRSTAAFMYMALNAIAAASAYGLLTTYADFIIPDLAQDQLLTSIVAGFGAMAVLRSKFFTLRTETGEDISVGPDAAISAFLNAADRGVDRARATQRLRLAFNRSSEIPPQMGATDFFQISLAAFQNVSDEDKARVTATIDKVAQSAYPPELQLQAICYAIMGVTGERNFNTMMDNLRSFLAGSTTTTGGQG